MHPSATVFTRCKLYANDRLTLYTPASVFVVVVYSVFDVPVCAADCYTNILPRRRGYPGLWKQSSSRVFAAGEWTHSHRWAQYIFKIIQNASQQVIKIPFYKYCAHRNINSAEKGLHEKYSVKIKPLCFLYFFGFLVTKRRQRVRNTSYIWCLYTVFFILTHFIPTVQPPLYPNDLSHSKCNPSC